MVGSFGQLFAALPVFGELYDLWPIVFFSIFQTINRLSSSLKEAEARCEKLENDIYDMKRELAEETKRFRDKWRDAKKKER